MLSAWPIRELWMTRELDRSEIDLDLADRPEQVLVHRVGFAVETQSIDALEALALERLLDGARLGEVMQALERLIPEAIPAQRHGLLSNTDEERPARPVQEPDRPDDRRVSPSFR